MCSCFDHQGDFPSTKKSLLWQLMRQIGDTGIENSKLRDEIFCQIIKQITDNAFECVFTPPSARPLYYHLLFRLSRSHAPLPP